MTHPARSLPPTEAAAPRPSLVPSPGASPEAAAPSLPTVGAPAWPWYRREPWLAVELLGFLPLLVALVVPRRLQLALIAAGGLLVALGLLLLWRQGPFAARRPTDRR